MLLQGMCQLFGIFYHFIFETFGQPETNQSGKSVPDNLPSEELIVLVCSFFPLSDLKHIAAG